MHHELKTWPEYFEEVLQGRKTFEVRKNDRNFHVGDTLRLLEWDHHNERYTGRDLFARVTYVLRGPGFGIEAGYCVMAIRI